MAEGQQDLEAFCRGEHRRLVGLLTVYVGNQVTAEELAQDAFARVCQHWPRVAGMANPRAWLNRVALNLATSWFRRRAAERRAQWRIGAGNPDRTHDTEATDSLVIREAIQALPTRQRQAVVLRYYADLPVAEVAEILGCAPGTVKALTHHGVNALRLQLGGPRTQEVTR